MNWFKTSSASFKKIKKGENNDVSFFKNNSLEFVTGYDINLKTLSFFSSN